MRENRKQVGLLIVLAIAAVAGGISWYAGSRDTQQETRLMLYGNVDIREADLAFNNAEHIAQILVQEGERVAQGQLLATLHRERAQAEAEAARAQLDSRRAALARLQAGSRPEEVRQSRASVVAAKARLADAEATYRRTARLHEARAASSQSLDDAQAALDTSRAELNVAEETLALAVAGPRREDIDEARALVKVAEAQLALARAILDDTELRAPARGIVRNRILEPGDMASPQKPVLTLALNNPVWVRAYASETVLGKLAPGMAAEVSTDSFPDKRYPGWIGFISPSAEFTPKNVETPELRTRLVYQVRIYVCNSRNELRLGMPASVAIPLDQPPPAPDHALPDCARPQDG